MHFSLSEQQLQMQASIDRFLADECPIARVQQIFNSEDGYDGGLWHELCQLGIPALAIPSEYGGMGLEVFDLALAAESLGAAATPGPFLGHALAGLTIAWAGDAAQRARWLPGLATGELLATMGLAEEDARWQPDEWSLECAQTLSGIKTFVPYASQAQLLVVGLKGGRFAVIEPCAQTTGCRQTHVVDRTRRVQTVEFLGAPAHVLSESTPGVARRVRDAGLVLLAADAFGGASRCVRMAVDYANTREQYGAKIGQFQGLKYQIVDTAVEVEPARGLYWYAAHAFTHIPEEAERMSALAKAHLSDVYLQAARNMIEVHGGIGYTWEFHAHLYLKRAMFDYAFLGMPRVHRRRAVELAGWGPLNS
jgi:alkylation response protein AidB-like acyl-CoA dehydrogenase